MPPAAPVTSAEQKLLLVSIWSKRIQLHGTCVDVLTLQVDEEGAAAQQGVWGQVPGQHAAQVDPRHHHQLRQLGGGGAGMLLQGLGAKRRTLNLYSPLKTDWLYTWKKSACQQHSTDLHEFKQQTGLDSDVEVVLSCVLARNGRQEGVSDGTRPFHRLLQSWAAPHWAAFDPAALK